MTTTITPIDTGLPAFTLAKDPDLGNEVSFDRNDRQVVSAGGVLHVLDKGPVAQGWPLQFSGLEREELEALDAYISDTLLGAVKRFRIEWGTHENLLTETVNLGLNPPWQPSGATQNPTFTFPADVLAPDFSNTALKIDFDAWTPDGANQKLVSFAERPEGEAVTVTNETVTIAGWFRAADGVTLTGSDRLKIQTDSEDSGIASLNLTDAWSFESLTYTFTTGGDNLAWEVGNVDPSSAHTLYVWQPQLVFASSASAGTYQVIPESAFGVVDLRFGDAPLSWRERQDNSFDVTLNLFKVGV